MNAAIVCVDYHDYLSIALLYNRHHFDDVLVVTAPHDLKTINWLQDYGQAIPYVTNSFYDDGADFNKWKGLEEALTEMDFRHGWLALVDADVLWPKDVLTPGNEWYTETMKSVARRVHELQLEIGKMYSPRRRMFTHGFPVPSSVKTVDGKTTCDVKFPPDENDWSKLPYHRYHGWSGYTQIFHCDDPHLPEPPWYGQDWKHAGGADSFFSELWPEDCRVRPDWEVLHLGECGRNWCGRTTPMLDGSLPPNAEAHQAALDQHVATRIANRGKGAGVFDPARYEGERVGD